MSILGANGKRATQGIMSLFHLTSGQIFYSETAIEVGDSFMFNGDQTLLVAISPGRKQGEMTLQMQKFHDSGFKGFGARVLKSSIVLIQDVTDEAFISKAHEALSGLTIVGG